MVVSHMFNFNSLFKYIGLLCFKYCFDDVVILRHLKLQTSKASLYRRNFRMLYAL